MKREVKRYWRFILLALATALLLAACSTASPSLTELKGAEEVALFTDADIDGAVLELAERVEELHAVEESTLPDGVESELPDSLEGEGELTTQAVLPGASGYIAYVRHNPNQNNPWQLWLSNQSNDAKTKVYQGKREIQSVAVNLSGNRLIFAMKQTTDPDSNFVVYGLNLKYNSVSRFTSTAYDVKNVSMSASGRTMAWQRTSPANKPEIVIRKYSGSGVTFSESTMAQSAPTGYTNLGQLEPSVSGNGKYIVFIRHLKKNFHGDAWYYQVVRYDVLNKSLLVVANSKALSSSTARSPFNHPSVSDSGGKVAWLEHTFRSVKNGLVHSSGQVKIKETTSGNITNAVSVGLVHPTPQQTIEHPHLTADARFLSYGRKVNGSWRVFTKNLSSGQVVQAVGGSSPVNNYAMFWQKAAPVLAPALN